MSGLDDLQRRGLIEAVDADPATAAQWLDDAGRHLEAATKIADLDPSGAYVLAYDAARRSVAAALLVAGHRVLSRPGSHQALTLYADSLAAQTGEPALKRFDRRGATETDPSTGRGASAKPKSPKRSVRPEPFAPPARISPDATTESGLRRSN